MDPTLRRLVFRAGGAFAALLAVGAVWGRHNALHGRYWMTKANGHIQFLHWGLASIGILLWLGLFALATSEAPARFEGLLPVRNRWARYLAAMVLTVLGIVVGALLLLMPVA